MGSEILTKESLLATISHHEVQVNPFLSPPAGRLELAPKTFKPFSALTPTTLRIYDSLPNLRQIKRNPSPASDKDGLANAHEQTRLCRQFAGRDLEPD